MDNTKHIIYGRCHIIKGWVAEYIESRLEIAKRKGFSASSSKYGVKKKASNE